MRPITNEIPRTKRLRPKSGTGEAAKFAESSPGKFGVSIPALALGGSIIAFTFLWAYWSTIEQLVHSWNTQPDYSHGFLVPLLAAFFLWNARNSAPQITIQFAWPGLLLVMVSIMLRVLAGYYYLPAIDGWSIPLWTAGVAWTFGGWPLLRWCLPAVVFLYFMVPLPYRVEGWLSLPLQSAATHLSVWSLQCLGQAAIAEGHTIHLGAHRLEVEQACSGLRMLVGTAALAVAYTMLFRKAWWERVILFASVAPVAVTANIIRIAATGLLYRYVSSDAGKRFTHDFAGWVMILIAAALFAAVLWYLKCLLPEQETMAIGDLLRTREEVPLTATQPTTSPG